MREILFRGKRVDNGEWIEGAFCPKNCDSFFGPMVDMPSIIKLDYPHSGYWFEVIGDTVGQYTGLTDKNGTKIFEGDIVKIKGKIRYIFFGICGFRHTNQNEHSDTLANVNTSENCEVIGNIHDNPERLRGADNG